MTRQELTNIRSLDFSKWVREKLPDSSTGYSASDLDFVLWNYKTKKIMLVEVKTRNATPRRGQQVMWELLDRWIKNGINRGWEYCGFYLIKFENTCFSDGKCFLSKIEAMEANEVTEDALVTFLSLV